MRPSARLKPLAVHRWIFLVAAALGIFASTAPAETVERIISREDPRYNAGAGLAAGRDGNLYLASKIQNDAYVLRVSPDGKERLGGGVVYALNRAVANAAGTIATANSHFKHSINFYDRHFRKLAHSFSEFRVGDTVGWDAPGSVDAGTSGDFYALDQHARRIVRLSPAGKLVRVFPIPEELKRPAGLRACEPLEAFFILSQDQILSRVGFDGKIAWSKKTGTIFDVGDDGGVILLAGGMLKRLSADGEPAVNDVALDPAPGKVLSIALTPAGLAVRRPVMDELFRIYDLDTGGMKHAVPSAHERVSAEFPDRVWTAGQKLAFTLSSSKESLQWKVWMTPLGDAAWREIELQDDHLAVPTEFAGLYQLRASPTLSPQTPSEYAIKAIIEVREAGAVGTASVWTPMNRVWWAQGETIPFSADLRCTGDASPRTAAIALESASSDAAPLWSTEITLEKGTAAQATVPASTTAHLAPGRYTLRIELPGHTCVAQPVRIGPGPTAAAPFRVTLHGDYGGFASKASVWDCADEADGRLARSLLLGVNQYVSRTWAGGYPLSFPNNDEGAGLLNSLKKQLEADAGGVSPAKAELGFPQGRVLAAYGAHGIHEWVLPIGMDAILPMGERASYGGLIDPKAVAKEVATYTEALHDFPAFQGWDWVANWWAKKGKAFASSEEKAAYNAALKQANETGVWSEVLTAVGERRIGWQVEAQASFKAALAATNATLRTASSGPYRRPEVYPPTSFANVDEVDLHFQAEQISCPNWTAHAADFYARPGKPAWLHPEVWNDSGTGGQILSTSWLGIMRGAGGIGCSGQMKHWENLPRDPRSGYDGILSVFRAIDDFVCTRGPWLAALEHADRVAIPVSRRHIEVDDWSGIGGRYFTRLWEAHQVCLHARRPASFVFAEDKPDMSRFKAVLLVGLRYEPEPAFTEIVRQAEQTGARVFADGTCRESLVKTSTPLGTACDHIEKTHPFNDDVAWWQIAPILVKGAEKAASTMAEIVPAVADCDQPEVLVGERRLGKGRFVWVVNNTRSRLDQAHLWRVQTGIATCEPVVARVGLPIEPGEVVYDMFDMREVTAPPAAVANGRQRLEFDADLRFSYARLYAVLPGRIGGVTISPSGPIEPGTKIDWSVAVTGGSQGSTGAGMPLAAALPVEVRLLDGDGAVVAEMHAASGSGRMTAPKNAKPPLAVAARELVSGRATKNWPAGAGSTPPASRFGPRIREVAVSRDGGSALLSAFDWGRNLYAIDTITGNLRWTGNVGDSFAYAPVAFGRDFAVTGYDLDSGEGYHLHVLSSEGAGQRRFALPGLPARLTHWAFPMLQDRLGVSAVAADGSWLAAAGNLAMAAWKPDGTLLWSLDWSRDTRKTPLLMAAGSRTLIWAQGMTLTEVDPLTGKADWEVSLGPTGSIQSIAASGDGKTVAAVTDADGGAVHLVTNGHRKASIPGKAAEVVLASDGSWVAIADGAVVRVHDRNGMPVWSLAVDSTVCGLRVAPDGSRLAVADDLGLLHVFDVAAGRRLFSRDLGGLAAVSWLPDGDLVAATWMGTAVRLTSDGAERWRVELAATKAPETRLGDVATTRLTSWSNAAPEPLSLTPNLLAEGAVITTMLGDKPVSTLSAKDLVDGDAKLPAPPLLTWSNIGQIDSGWRGSCSIVLDTFRTQLRLDAVTILEDPDHPESWMRDARLEYWDPAESKWIFAQYLTSDAQAHSHTLSKPVEAARFRLTRPDGPGWPASNLRIAKLVFHGKRLGSSHPDVVAGRPVITLFDEDKEAIACLKSGHHPQFDFQTDQGASGSLFAVLKAEGNAGPSFAPVFGHSVPNWAFTVVETPEKPGEIRWLEFAWKAMSPQTRGMSLQLGRRGGLTFSAGEATPFEGASALKRADAPPADWTVERVDLWSIVKQAKQPFWIGSIGLGAVGGGAAFDRIRLAKTEQDLLDRQETKGLDPNP